MAFDDPAITITGNLAGDPELRFTASGTAVVSFTVAHTPRQKNAAGEWVDGTTLFLRCNAWRYLAEHVAESLSKGQRVTVRGTLRANKWTTDKGEERTSFEVTADDVAASLTYANVKITKAARNGSDVPPPSDPWTGEVATSAERPEASAEA